MLRLLRRFFRPPAARPRRAAPAPAAAPRSAAEGPYAEWLAIWGATWSVPDLPSRVQIEFSRRIRHSLGRCYPTTGLIRLNPALLDADPEALREVVCHEAAHVAAWLLHGQRARPHGREWKELMRLAGYEARVRWAQATLPEAVRERRRSAAGG